VVRWSPGEYPHVVVENACNIVLPSKW
jgi:hypothetical protein